MIARGNRKMSDIYKSCGFSDYKYFVKTFQEKCGKTPDEYSKVLAADMIDWEKMQNHFLLTAASLNSQLLDTYDLGLDAEGKNTPLTPENLYGFFMDLLKGKFDIQELDGTFQISDISEKIHGAS